MANPWQTAEGGRAREQLFRRLAAGEGAIADFAKDVVSGARRPDELFTYSPASEEINQRLTACARLWHRVPHGIREEAVRRAPETLRAYVHDLAAEAPEPSTGSDRPKP